MSNIDIEKTSPLITDATNPYEMRHMQLVKDRYKHHFDSFTLIPVDAEGENLGFMMINQNNPPQRADWILTDLDDTMIDTQGVKLQRLQLFDAYLTELGIAMPGKEVERILQSTDEFARWLDTPNGSPECYHPIAHMAALNLVITELQGVQKHSAIAQKEAVDKALKRCLQIKQQLTENIEPSQNDPFRFKDKDFFIREFPAWTQSIEDIFMETMVAPPRYRNNIAAFEPKGTPPGNMATEDGTFEGVNTGIITSGVPSYQLHKIGELLNEHPSLHFSIILFTRVGKEQFMQDFVRRQEIENSVIILYDDSIDNAKKHQALQEGDKKGNKYVAVVARTPYAKDANMTSANFITIHHTAINVGEKLRKARGRYKK